MNPIETAAKAIAPWLTFQGEPGWPEKVAVHVIETWVRGAVGCPTCKGTGEAISPLYPTRGINCPAEHVKLTVLGETIYADPDKCEWRCAAQQSTALLHEGLCLGRSTQTHTSRGIPIGHDPKAFGCGWQPRMDLLLGGE